MTSEQKRKIETALNVIQDARASATMRLANFDTLHMPTFIAVDGKVVVNSLGGGEGVTKFIRERTELFRQSWIIGPIDGATDAIRRVLEEA